MAIATVCPLSGMGDQASGFTARGRGPRWGRPRVAAEIAFVTCPLRAMLADMETTGRNRTERRLAAIVAADVAGYSRLMRAAQAGTAARTRSVRADGIAPAI